MTLLELLEDCARQGIELAPDGDKLLVRAPHGGITPELNSALQRHKHDILGRLRRSPENFVSLSATPRHSDTQSLSLAQQSLWFLHRLDPATLPAYNIRKAFVLEGAIDAQRWAKAFQTVVDRHESLRYTFESIDEHPVARVAASVAPLDIVDLTHLDAEAQSLETQRRIDREGRHAFDLATPPLLHASLLLLSAERSVLILNAHHLIADAWSAGIILREIAEVHEGRLPKKTALPYRDYVQWQRQRVDAGEIEPHLAYWRKSLWGCPPRLPRITGMVRLPHAVRRPARHNHHTTAPRNRTSCRGILRMQSAPSALRAARRSSLMFLASFAALLHRYSGQDDFPIGTSVAGRTRSEFEDIVGLFADLLVLRMDAGGDPSLPELLDRVQQISGEGVRSPGGAVRRSGQGGKAGARHWAEPAFPGAVPLPSERSEIRRGAGAERVGEVRPQPARRRCGIGDPRPGSNTGRRSSNPPLIRRFLAAWLEVLQAAVADPSRKIAELPVLSAAARHDLLFARNEAHASSHPYTTLREAFEAQVENGPDRHCGEGGRPRADLSRTRRARQSHGARAAPA